MTTKYFLGSSIATQKVLLVQFSETVTTTLKIGLGSSLLVYGPGDFNQATLISDWNSSSDLLLSDITASEDEDTGGVRFTHDTPGQDFELTLLFEDENGDFVEANLISEVQRLTFVNNVTGGTFTLTFDGEETSAITYDPGDSATVADDIKDALEALSNVQVGDVTVTAASATVFDIGFSNGQYAGLDLDMIEADFSSLTGGNAAITIATVQHGNSGTNEIVSAEFPEYGTYAADVNEVQVLQGLATVSGGTFTLSMAGYGTTSALPYNAKRSQVRNALNAMFQDHFNTAPTTAYVSITGYPAPVGPMQIEFIGALAATDLPLLSVDTSNLTADEPAVVIDTIQDSSTTGSTPLTGSNASLEEVGWYAPDNGSGSFNFPNDLELNGSVELGYNSFTDAFAQFSALLPIDAPQGSPITDPYLEFKVSSGTIYPGVYTSAIRLAYEDEDDVAALPADSTELQARSYVYSPAMYAFLYVNEYEGGSYNGHRCQIRLGSFASALTALVARPGWSAGNNAHFVFMFIPTTEMGLIIDSGSVEISYNYLGGGTTTSEIQSIELINDPVDGEVEITLDGDTTTGIPFNATAEEIEDALEALSSVGVGNVSCTGGPWPAQVVCTFDSSLGNLPEMTATETFSSPPIGLFAVDNTAGGTVNLPNISGGTFDLGFRKTGSSTYTWVTLIPYDVSPSELETLINAVLGANSVSCAGTALPAGTVTIEFDGNSWDARSIDPVLVRLSLESVIGGTVSNDVVHPAKARTTTDNCYDMTVIPGRGTMAMNYSADWNQDENGPVPVAGNCNWGSIRITTTSEGVLLTDYFRWVGCTALDIENVINEVFGKDVCRVYEVNHSLEEASVPDEYGGSPTDSLRTWYNRDVFRIVFHSDYADPDTIEDIEFVWPQLSGEDVGVAEFMKTDDGSEVYDDFALESTRTYNAFLRAEEIGQPLHDVSISPGVVESELLTFRYKLLSRYIEGGYEEQSGSLITTQARAVTAEFDPDLLVKLSWVIERKTGNVEEGVTTTEIVQTVATTDWLPYDAPVHVIQRALEAMLVQSNAGQVVNDTFFGAGNVIVTGSLVNSHLTEGFEAFDDNDSYNDLRVVLTGKWASLPLDIEGYNLVMTLKSGNQEHYTPTGGSVSPTNDNQQYNYPYPWSSIIARPIPPFRNYRQRISYELFDDFEATIGITFGDTFIELEDDTTAAELQELLNDIAGLGQLTYTGTNAGRLTPERWGRAVTVFGTTVSDGPMEIEFTGYGQQYATPADTFQYTITPTGEDILALTVTQEGVTARTEIQTVALSGSPYAGAFTLTFDGQTTSPIAYNASAATVQTELLALSNIDPGEVTVTGGPVDDATLTVTFVSSMGNVPQLTHTVTTPFENQQITVTEFRAGGVNGAESLGTITELVRGAGPRYLDVPENYADNKCLNSGDTLVIENAVSPIQFGLDCVADIKIVTLGSDTKFKFLGSRRVFLDGQKVYMRGTGTLPANFAAGYYYIVDGADDLTFGLSATEGGAAVQSNDPGNGTITLELRELTVEVYSRFAGKAIGLPIRRSNTALEYLERHFKAGFDLITLGISDGDGLSLGCFDAHDSAAAVTVLQTDSGPAVGIPAIQLLFNNEDARLDMSDGDVGIAVYPMQTSSMDTYTIVNGNLFLGTVEFAGAQPEATGSALITRRTGTAGPSATY